MTRYLPLINPDGKLDDLWFFTVFGYMHFPSDPITAEALGYLAVQAGKAGVTEMPIVLRELGKDMERRNPRGMVAASVLATVLSIPLNDKPSLRKGFYAAAEAQKSEPSHGRKRGLGPSNERDIRRQFQDEFGSVSHLWMAYMIFGQDEERILSDAISMHSFIQLAENLADEFVDRIPDAAVELWRFPPRLVLDIHLDLKGHTSKPILEVLKRYRSVEYRDS